jgi:hypothetical protein
MLPKNLSNLCNLWIPLPWWTGYAALGLVILGLLLWLLWPLPKDYSPYEDLVWKE